MQQDELFTRRSGQVSTVLEKDTSTVVALLKRAGKWVTTTDILSTLSGAYSREWGEDLPKRYNRTHIRHIAQAAAGLITSGQKGHIYTPAATGEEVNVAAAAMMNAATGILDRRKAMLYVFHHGHVRREDPSVASRLSEATPPTNKGDTDA